LISDWLVNSELTSALAARSKMDNNEKLNKYVTDNIKKELARNLFHRLNNYTLA